MNRVRLAQLIRQSAIAVEAAVRKESSQISGGSRTPTACHAVRGAKLVGKTNHSKARKRRSGVQDVPAAARTLEQGHCGTERIVDQPTKKQSSQGKSTADQNQYGPRRIL